MRWFALLLVGCAHAGASEPVADVDPGGPQVVDRGVTQGAPAAPRDDFDQECEPEMFSEQPPGARGLSAFEDPSGLSGYRGEGGKVAIAPRFRMAYEFNQEGLAAVVDDDGPAFIDTSGKVLARAYLFDNGPDYFVAGRARIVENGKLGFIDRKGHLKVKPAYDYATPFCEARAGVCNGCRIEASGEYQRVVGGRWGYIDPNGRVVVPLELDDASPFHEGEAEVTKRGKRMVIDRSGAEIKREPAR